MLQRTSFTECLLAGALLLAGCASAAPRADAGVEKPPVIAHASWEETPPVGHAADAVRRNLAPGDTLRFHELTVILHAMHAASARGEHNTAVLELRSATGAVERRTAGATSAFNWEGYRVALIYVNTDTAVLGAGLVELEVATVASLPPAIAAATTAGDATYRLRVPHRIHTITLHHTGSANAFRPDQDPVARVRRLQAWGRTDRNWWDVPYHFLLDLDGNIYEGRDYRYVGDTNTRYDPTGHLLITVIGNYELQEPTPAQIASITNLMAWAAAEFDVPLDRIYGHGDMTETLCPGRYLKAYLEDGTFRRGVETRLRGR